MMATPAPHNLPWTHRAAIYGWAGESLWTQFLRMSGQVDKADAIETARLAAHKAQRVTISICHPTRGRPDQAARVRKAWLDAAADGERIEHIFAMEADSPDLDVLGRFRHALAPAGLLGRASGNCVLANNAAARAARGDVLIFASDDMGRPPLHWDAIIDDELGKAAKANEPAMLRVSDGQRRDDLIVTPCVTRAVLPRLGYGGGIYAEEYASMFADTELSVRADANGWLRKSRLIIPHDHPAHNPDMPMHETTARNNSLENYRKGFDTFKRRNPEFCADSPDFVADMEKRLKEAEGQ
jgi:hypothetical protein